MSVHRCVRCTNDGKVAPLRRYQVDNETAGWIYLCGDCVTLIVMEWHIENYNPVLRRYSPQRLTRKQVTGYQP